MQVFRNGADYQLQRGSILGFFGSSPGNWVIGVPLTSLFVVCEWLVHVYITASVLPQIRMFRFIHNKYYFGMKCILLAHHDGKIFHEKTWHLQFESYGNQFGSYA